MAAKEKMYFVAKILRLSLAGLLLVKSTKTKPPRKAAGGRTTEENFETRARAKKIEVRKNIRRRDCLGHTS